MVVETVDGNVQHDFKGHGEAIDSLGQQLHDMIIKIGNNPNTFLDGNASVWECLLVVNKNVDGAYYQLTSDLSSLVTAAVAEIQTELLASAKGEACQEFQASINLMKNDMHSLLHKCRQVSRDHVVLNGNMTGIAREQALINQQPTFDPSFTGDW
jgi:hypothetical protein